MGVCDRKYAESYFPTDRVWCPRHFLHSYHLRFLDVPKASDAGETARLARLRAQADFANGTRPAERELLEHALVQASIARREQNPVNVYCQLPEDLRTVL